MLKIVTLMIQTKKVKAIVKSNLYYRYVDYFRLLAWSKFYINLIAILFCKCKNEQKQLKQVYVRKVLTLMFPKIFLSFSIDLLEMYYIKPFFFSYLILNLYLNCLILKS